MELKAKTTSLIGMVIGGICLLGLFVAVLIKFLTIPDFTITFNQALALIVLGIAPSVPFCPVYLSIILDKAKEMKELKKELKSIADNMDK